ncbi:MAG: rod shape-determining protein [Firmicutes bacterium]|nr:rod shape-determining protein [Bacillota bacterium]
MKYIVDIGSKHLSIYHNGLVLREPNIAVICKVGQTLELISAGKACYSLLGNTREDYDFVAPVEENVVKNPETASLILKHFLPRIIPKNFFRKAEIVVPVSSGLSLAERESYEEVVLRAGYQNVTLIENILGFKPYVDKAQAVMNIGVSSTDIGVVSRTEGIIAGCSVNIGCAQMDARIAERLEASSAVRISSSTAEKLREEVGNLFGQDKSVTEIIGTDIVTKVNRKFLVSSDFVKQPLLKAYGTLFEIAESLIATIPYRIIQDITAKGIYIAGQGANVPGLSAFVLKTFKMGITIDPEPEIAVLRGLF